MAVAELALVMPGVAGPLAVALPSVVTVKAFTSPVCLPRKLRGSPGEVGSPYVLPYKYAEDDRLPS